MAIEIGGGGTPSGGGIGSPSSASPGGVSGIATHNARVSLKGDSKAAAGTYETYRQMRSSPTVAIARAVATSAIKAAQWSYESEEGTPDEITSFVREEMETHRRKLLNDGLRSLDYGFQPVVIEWGISTEGRKVVTRLAPKLPDDVTIEVYANTREFAGIKVVKDGKTTVYDADEVVLFVYDAEADGMYGRSRMENIREHAWMPWRNLVKRIGNYVDKTAGIVPMVEYPEGESMDANGTKRSNFEIAAAILKQVSSGAGVAMPKDFSPWANDLLNKGANPADLMSWSIKFLDTKPGPGSEFLALSQHFESLQMRGWLVPERTAIEGSRGTLAEAEQHADVALAVAQEDADWIAEQVTNQVVRKLIRDNFGSAWEKSVRITAAPIVSDSKAFIRQIVSAVFTNPNNVDLLSSMLDFDAMIDQSNLPKAKQVVEVTDTGTPPVPSTTAAKLARFITSTITNEGE